MPLTESEIESIFRQAMDQLPNAVEQPNDDFFNEQLKSQSGEPEYEKLDYGVELASKDGRAWLMTIAFDVEQADTDAELTAGDCRDLVAEITEFIDGAKLKTYYEFHPSQKDPERIYYCYGKIAVEWPGE